jgi:polyphosphate glucokinase
MEASKKIQKPSSASVVRTLAIDIGGSGIKTVILDSRGQPLGARLRIPTPRPAVPKAILKVIEEMVKQQGEFERASVGFPGVVRNGVTETAFNLHPKWEGFPLAKELSKMFGKPVAAANDADVQGFGSIKSDGVELVITLGTGLGSALFVDGKLVPNLQMAHQPFRKGKTYEDYLGQKGIDKLGKKKWNKKLAEAIDLLRAQFNFDHLYIGGGNNRLLKLKLQPWAKTVSNDAGLWGGIALWHQWTRVEHGPERAG